jgi:hypothetical protein
VVDRPLRKDFGVITQHVTEVTHRLAWQEYLIDAQRILRAGKIDAAIREHYGPEVLKAMRDTIEDIAAGEVAAQNAFESGMNYLRTGATIAGLGWRLTTSLLQPIGLTQSWCGSGRSTSRAAWSSGSATRRRWRTPPSASSRSRASCACARRRCSARSPRSATPWPAELGHRGELLLPHHEAAACRRHPHLARPVPQGRRERRGREERVAQADQAVLDAQGGGQIKDLAGIQRGGPLLKLFTNFYSFFNTTYNLTGEAVGRTKFAIRSRSGRLAVDLLLLYTVPAVLGTLLKAALHSGDDGADDEKKLVRQVIADQLTYLFGTMVGLREIAGGANGARAAGRLPRPGERAASSPSLRSSASR